MIIGYAVEDAGHKALIVGLQRRWCPGAQLVEGAARGRSGVSLRRDIPKICRALSQRGAAVVVIIRDANDQDWRDVLQRERRYVPPEFQHCVIYGVAARNVECWITLNRDYAARRLDVNPSELDVVDPKPVVVRALGITAYQRRVEDIAEMVAGMPFGRNLTRNTEAARSLKEFYDEAHRSALRMACKDFPNELDTA